VHKQWADFLNGKVTGANATVKEVEIGDSSITVETAHLYAACEALKNSEWDFNVLEVVSGVDWVDHIEVNYMLASFTKGHELILKVKLPYKGDELPDVDSVVGLWRSADFQERECYDMLGVNFVGHPDLRRILCVYDWEGYPLRKNYVVQEKYKNLVVNPPAKMNRADHDFAKELLAKTEDPKKVSHSWDYKKVTLTSPKADETETSTTEGEE
jgi:NADH-quinone oxidoreductase subunit C